MSDGEIIVAMVFFEAMRFFWTDVTIPTDAIIWTYPSLTMFLML